MTNECHCLKIGSYHKYKRLYSNKHITWETVVRSTYELLRTYLNNMTEDLHFMIKILARHASAGVRCRTVRKCEKN